MACAKSNLLSLCKVFIDSPIQDHFANLLDRDELFWPNLRRIQDVEVEIMLILLRDHLNTKYPLGRTSGCDGFLEIFAVEIYDKGQKGFFLRCTGEFYTYQDLVQQFSKLHPKPDCARPTLGANGI